MPFIEGEEYSAEFRILHIYPSFAGENVESEPTDVNGMEGDMESSE